MSSAISRFKSKKETIQRVFRVGMGMTLRIFPGLSIARLQANRFLFIGEIDFLVDQGSVRTCRITGNHTTLVKYSSRSA